MDIKGPHLIKPVNLEGVRKIGDPKTFALDYYQQGIDEIIYMDAVASLYDRNSLSDLVRETVQDIFVPLTVGGGIRSVKDAEAMLLSGADKVAVNTAAIRNPQLINDLSRTFGSQCVVLSIEAKRREDWNSWEAYIDCGREKTGVNVLDWAQEAVDRGAGEILLTSVDFEGTCDGFDIELCKAVTPVASVPVVLSGGMGELDHAVEAFKEGHADSIAMAHVLHHKKTTVDDMRTHLKEHGIFTREPVAL